MGQVEMETKTIMKVKELYSNKWISLRTVEDKEKGVPPYVYKHVTPSDGHTIVVLPWKITDDGSTEFLTIYEVRPCWSINEKDLSMRHLQSITGAIDNGEKPEIAALRELVEETGYRATRKNITSLGTTFCSKASDTIYHMFAVDLTNVEQGEKETTEQAEQDSVTMWLESGQLGVINDPLVAQMYMRFSSIGLESMTNHPVATRVEVIDGNGRSYVNWNKTNKISTSFQDDGKTLKVFIEKKEKTKK